MEYESGEVSRDSYVISTDRSRLDIDTVHGYLHESYWCAGIPRDLLERAIHNSLCFGLYTESGQAGFARVITDFARHGSLVDVFILKPYRGKGLGTWLVQTVVGCPLLKELRSITLGTRDAHEVCGRCGFAPLEDPKGVMILTREMTWWRQDLVAE